MTRILHVTARLLATFAGLGLPAGDILAQGSAETDRAALVALYDATDGPNWKNSTNWLTDASLSDSLQLEEPGDVH